MQLVGYLRPARPCTLSWAWIGLLLLGMARLVHASDLPAPITLDLPVPANRALPAWLGQPETPSTTFATLNLPILTPDTSASLLVTVYFQEKEGGFMRIAWQGTQGAEVLSDNFYEGIGMANQRSLLITPSTLVGDGILTFQCGDSTLGIQRIKLEWLEDKTSLVSPDVRDLLVTPATGPTQLSQSLNGQANPTLAGAWQNQLVTVPITDQALRIEQGVELSVDLDKVPVSARVALQEDGLPVGKHLVVWVNQQRAGTITPVVPDLLDNGFLADETGSITYVGWRDGSFYVPVSLLKTGVNTLQFSDEDDTAPVTGSAVVSQPGQESPLAIKAMVMQLNYQTVGTKTDLVPTSLSATPAEPTAPAASSPNTSTTTTP